jgi:undecaprenyl-diphosphatase
VVVGSIPIGIVGLVLKDFITGPLRSLWVVGIALIAWSGVMIYAEGRHRATRHEDDITVRDAIFVGLFQCIALIPGVSRSGATISAGLFRGLDRAAAARYSFLLSIPAVVLSGLFELRKIGGEGGAGFVPTAIATVLAFVVGYASIAFLLRYLARHSLMVFVVYRMVLGALVVVLAATGKIS